MKDVTVALAGIGGYGKLYAGALLDAAPERKVRLVAGIDPLPQRSQHWEAFKAAKIPVYADLERFFEDTTADLIVVAAPIHLHASLTCLALSHGCNVLCEKPLCATIQEAHAMAEAKDRAGRVVAIGYQWSFSDAIQTLKRDILAGELGRPIRLKTKVFWPRPVSYFGRSNWAGRIRMPNGRWVLDSPANNATAHFLHNMYFVLGDRIESSARPVSVQAELYRANPIENYDAAAIRSVTQEGTETLFYTAHAVAHEAGPILRFEFERATVDYARSAGVISARFRDGRVKAYGDPFAAIDNKLWHAINAVRTGEPVACGIDAATSHTLCINGAQESSEITSFPEHMLHRDDKNSDPLVWVEGLQSSFEECYAQNTLPADSAAIPWARKGKTVDLRNYVHFPSVRPDLV